MRGSFALLIALAVLQVPGLGVAAGVSFGPLGYLGGQGIERGIARLMCRGEASNQWHRSRVFVVDTGVVSPHRELLLAAAHGLPRDPARVAQDCEVYGVHGRPARVVEVRRHRGAMSASDDWAILMTHAPLEGDVGRLRVAALAPEVLVELSQAGAPIKMLLYSDRTGLGDCALLGAPWIRAQELDRGLFAHSCRSQPGLSGSPIVAGMNGEPVAIGLNIGYRMRPSQVAGPLFYGIGRAFDEEIAAAIREARDAVAFAPSESRQ